MIRNLTRNRFAAGLVLALASSVLVMMGSLAHAVAHAQFYA